MDDRAAQLTFEQLKGQSQFAYFQLGVAASAIAFAIHETQNLRLADAPWPIGLGAGLWALSFALGCFGIQARQGALYINAAYLQTMQQIGPAAYHTDLSDLVEQMRNDVEASLSRAGLRFGLQMWALFAGALAYVAGHIMHMAALPANSLPH